MELTKQDIDDLQSLQKHGPLYTANYLVSQRRQDLFREGYIEYAEPSRYLGTSRVQISAKGATAVDRARRQSQGQSKSR